MKETLTLINFFISSYYQRLRQPLLKVILLLAFIYMFIQLTIINISVYLIAEIHVFLFYNLTISSIFVYILTCYLSTSQVFVFNEFKRLVPLPLSHMKISIAKLSSSVLVPIILSLFIQLPILAILLIDMKFTEMFRVLIYTPIINGLISLSLLFILSFVNRIYYKFKSVPYFMVNVFVMIMLPIIMIYTGSKIRWNLFSLIKEVSLETFAELIKSINYILDYIYMEVNKKPLIELIMTPYISNEITLKQILIYVLIIIICAVLFAFTIHNITKNYFRNGLADDKKINVRGTRVNITGNKWSNYLQREIWVIMSEGYFKFQIIIGLLLTPVIAVVLLLLIKNGVFIKYDGIIKADYLDKYFAYSIMFLCCINNISGTPYSREGKYHALLKYYPFNPRYVYFSKVIMSSIMSIIAVIISFITLVLFGYWSNETIVLLLIVSSVIICYNLLTPLFDKKNPLVEWENASEAVKSNPNVLVSLLFGMPILIGVTTIHFILVWLNVQSFIVSIIILLMVLTILSILIKRFNNSL